MPFVLNSDLANTCILSEVAVTDGQILETTIMINQFNKLYFIIGANGGIRSSSYVFPVSFILNTLADKEYIISSDEVVEGYTAFIQFYIRDYYIYIKAVGTGGCDNPPTLTIYGSL